MRPRIKIKLTAIDKAVEAIGWSVILITWTLVFSTYCALPDIIPTHYNNNGDVDGYGNKAAIFVLPIVSTVLFAGMTTLIKFPHIFNYCPSKITNENALQQYTNATKIIRYLKFFIVVFLCCIVIKTIQSVWIA